VPAAGRWKPVVGTSWATMSRWPAARAARRRRPAASAAVWVARRRRGLVPRVGGRGVGWARGSRGQSATGVGAGESIKNQGERER
jgi:hypothetical protein